jgi:hypothetical protein
VLPLAKRFLRKSFCYSKDMNSIPCDIVLLPGATVAKQAYSLSAVLELNDTFFTLRDGSFFPHASLYMTQLKLSDLSHVSTLLNNIASNTSQINLVAKEYHQEAGYIDIEYLRTQLVDNLQMKVIETINPMRDDLREKDKLRLQTAVGKERENIEKYGYRSVGELFAPHLTLTRFKSVDPIETVNLPDVRSFDTVFERIGLFEMGDNGTCVRKIAEFNLNK